MSIWTFKPLLAIGLCLSLGACQSVGTSFGFSGGPAKIPDGAELQTKQTLPGGVVIAGPFGYCPDTGTQKGVFSQGAIAFASCVRVAGSEDFDSTGGRLLSATSFGVGSVNLASLREFLTSDDGQNVLSANEIADEVTIHKTLQTKVAVYIDYSDKGRAAHLGQRSWRAFVHVKDTTVMLSVYAGAGEAVGGEPGESLIRDFAAATIDQNTPSR